MVSLKAKVLRQQHLATVAAATTSPALPAADAAAAADASHATPGQLPPPHAEAPDVSNALGAAAAIQAAPAGPKEGTGTAAAASDGAASVKDASAGNEASSSAAAAHGRASRQSSTVVQRSGPGPSFLGWDLAGEEEDLGSEDWGDCLPCSESQARLWSTQSTAGSVATAGEPQQLHCWKRRSLSPTSQPTSQPRRRCCRWQFPGRPAAWTAQPALPRHGQCAQPSIQSGLLPRRLQPPLQQTASASPGWRTQQCGLHWGWAWTR